MTNLTSKVSENEVSNLVEAHNKIQLGCYFSNIESCLSGTLSTSKYIDDFFWNIMSGFQEDDISELVQKSEVCFEKHNRVKSFYIDPRTRPLNAIESLEEIGFSIEREVWMSPKDKIGKPDIKDDISIEIVDASSKTDFLKVFSIAFGGESTDQDGYGDIPPSYLDALSHSVDKGASKGVTHVHFIARINEKTVGCGSIHMSKKFAGLYNIGTLPEERKKGIGKAISLNAMYYAETNNVKKIFLQTKPKGSIQSFYEGLGCEVIFEAAIAFKE